MDLERSNYKTVAAKLYRNPVLSDDEFEQDMMLLRRVPRRLERFCETGEINTRLVFNNFIIACNCFGQDFVVKAMFLLSDPKYHSTVFTFIDATVGISQTIRVNKHLSIRTDEFLYDSGILNRITRDLEDFL